MNELTDADRSGIADLLTLDGNGIESRGNLTLASSDPRDRPLIRMNFLATDKDLRTMRAGIRMPSSFQARMSNAGGSSPMSQLEATYLAWREVAAEGLRVVRCHGPSSRYERRGFAAGLRGASGRWLGQDQPSVTRRERIEQLRFGPAWEAIDRWKDADPDDPQPYLLRAEVASRTGASPQILADAYRQALARNSRLGPARLGLAEALRSQGNEGREWLRLVPGWAPQAREPASEHLWSLWPPQLFTRPLPARV